MTTPTPTERAAAAMAIEPDPTDRDAIARARSRVCGQASLTRDAVRNLASGPLSDEVLDLLAGAVYRLRALRDRIRELDALAKTALQAQVDADPEMTGATVQDDGRISGPSEQDQARSILALMDSGKRATYAQLALFERFYDEARRAGCSPAGAATYVRQELEALTNG